MPEPLQWPSERTAILVIHGVGQQSPFEPLDSFVRGLLETIKADAVGPSVKAVHSLVKQDEWVTNCISLRLNGQAQTAIDCYEYYWAHLTQREVQSGDVFDWLIDTGKAARKYYDENTDLVNTYEGQTGGPLGRLPVVGRKVRFDRYWYLKQLGTGLFFVRPLLLLLGVISNVRPLGSVVRGLLNAVSMVARPVLVNSVGDIMVYTAADMKSKHFEVRQRILDGAVKNIRWLLELPAKESAQEPAKEYGSVIVAGHSLGSVIGYDALNRINNLMKTDEGFAEAAPRLKGFVSFGSPLDKVAYFFRARVDDTRYVRKQILAQLIAFKAKDLNPNWKPPHKLATDPWSPLGHVRWINFWGPRDPISGPLDFYDLKAGDNRRLELGGTWGVGAHSNYWQSGPGMYQAILNELVCGTPAAGESKPR